MVKAKEWAESNWKLHQAVELGVDSQWDRKRPFHMRGIHLFKH